MHEQEHPSATYDSGATRRQKVVLISRQGDSARTLAATLCTHADSTTMVVADEAPRGPLVPWHAARIPDWVSLPARIVRGIETAGADRASLAAVVFQSRHAIVDSEEDLFVGVLPRPLDARVYTAPVVLALRADVDAGDNIAWLDMDAEACDLMLDSWLAGPLLDADTCATARTEFDADSSAMSTDDERHTNAEVAPPATTTTTDDDDERQGTDGRTPAARAALKARRRGRATPTPRRKSRRDRATAVADDDRSSHATDDEDAPAPRRRLRASRRAPRHVAGERDDEGDEDDENNGGGGGGLADDVGRGVEEDDDDDVCRDDSDDDLRTAEADDDLGDDDMSDVGDNDDVDDDDGDLDGIGGANGDMDDDLADDEEGDMDDDPNAE